MYIYVVCKKKKKLVFLYYYSGGAFIYPMDKFTSIDVVRVIQSSIPSRFAFDSQLLQVVLTTGIVSTNPYTYTYCKLL